MNTLHFGDNLQVLRDHIGDESVDLIYLDPPFNSQATYNVLFEENSAQTAGAQVEAFRDTWEWGESAAEAYDDVMRAAGDVALVMKGLKSWLGNSAMMAYLAMMTARLLHLRRALKPTGSLYLHCDPKASHYLKLILDAIFGHDNFQNEIIWKRTSAHSGAKRYGPVHDTLLFYSRGSDRKWNVQYGPYDQQYIDSFFTHEDEKGRRWRRTDLTGPGVRSGDSGLQWRDYNPTERGRHWQPPSYFYERYTRLTGEELAPYPLIERLEKMDALGMIHWPKKAGGMPQGKRFLEDAPGIPLQDIWTDIKPIHNISAERLGYPTQKPISLLERIIKASSDEGDTILDPFCGCGTSVEAAEALGRKWIGIDVTHYAVTLIERRLKARHPDAGYEVQGRPVDLAGARDLARRDKHQFQWWAAWRVGAHTYREEKRGADRGIDGNIFFKNGPYGDGRIIISVKGGENVGVQMVRDLRGVIEREEAEMGVLVTLANPTKHMLREALEAGVVRRSAHGRMPRLQIVTAADLLEGRPPKLPPLPVPERHPIRAPRRRHRDQLELLLPFPGEKVVPEKNVIVDPRFVQLG